MKLLNIIFNTIKPENKITWLSMRFAWFEQARHRARNERFKKHNTTPSVWFDVPGAGEVCMSVSCHHRTGGVVGFSFGVEWGRYGYVGGVMGRDEALRMANHIISQCATVTESMQEEYARQRKEFFEEATGPAKGN